MTKKFYLIYDTAAYNKVISVCDPTRGDHLSGRLFPNHVTNAVPVANGWCDGPFSKIVIFGEKDLDKGGKTDFMRRQARDIRDQMDELNLTDKERRIVEDCYEDIFGERLVHSAKTSFQTSAVPPAGSKADAALPEWLQAQNREKAAEVIKPPLPRNIIQHLYRGRDYYGNKIG